MTGVDVWGEIARENLSLPVHGWLDALWLLQSRVWPKIYSDIPRSWWAPEAFDRVGVPTGGKWLSLGCGAGHAEIALVQHGSVSEVLGLDPSAGAIDVAKELAAAAGISERATYAISAAEYPEFEPNSVDVVHMNMSLHHVSELEWLIAQIFSALRPGGLFVANEFVGPKRFQWSAARLEQVACFLSTIPDHLRRDYRDNAIKVQQEHHKAEWWIAHDPTESVRSSDILPLLRAVVPDLTVLPYGGNIANLVLENIIHNFDPSRAEDQAVMKRLWEADDKSVAEEGPDFVYIIARKTDTNLETSMAWKQAAQWLKGKSP